MSAAPDPTSSVERAVPEIRQSVFIQASIGRVFEVLTTSEGWNAWFTDASVVDREAGRMIFQWNDIGPNHASAHDEGPILSLVPDREFVFQWRPGVEPTTVAFRLSVAGQGVRVDLVESGYTMHPKDLHALVDCAGGWGEALVLLKFYLEYGITRRATPWP